MNYSKSDLSLMITAIQDSLLCTNQQWHLAREIDDEQAEVHLHHKELRLRELLSRVKEDWEK